MGRLGGRHNAMSQAANTIEPSDKTGMTFRFRSNTTVASQQRDISTKTVMLMITPGPRVYAETKVPGINASITWLMMDGVLRLAIPSPLLIIQAQASDDDFRSVAAALRSASTRVFVAAKRCIRSLRFSDRSRANSAALISALC